MKNHKLRILLTTVLLAGVLFTSAPRSEAILLPIFYTVVGGTAGNLLIIGVFVVAVGGTVYYVTTLANDAVDEMVNGPKPIIPDPGADPLLGTGPIPPQIF